MDGHSCPFATASHFPSLLIVLWGVATLCHPYVIMFRAVGHCQYSWRRLEQTTLQTPFVLTRIPTGFAYWFVMLAQEEKSFLQKKSWQVMMNKILTECHDGPTSHGKKLGLDPLPQHPPGGPRWIWRIGCKRHRGRDLTATPELCWFLMIGPAVNEPSQFNHINSWFGRFWDDRLPVIAINTALPANSYWFVHGIACVGLVLQLFTSWRAVIAVLSA